MIELFISIKAATGYTNSFLSIFRTDFKQIFSQSLTY